MFLHDRKSGTLTLPMVLRPQIQCVVTVCVQVQCPVMGWLLSTASQRQQHYLLVTRLVQLCTSRHHHQPSQPGQGQG